MRKQIFNLIKLLSLNYFFQRNKKNRLLVLMFHQVNDRTTNFYPSMPISVFEDVCNFVNKHYEVIHVSEVTHHFQKSKKPAAIITFDDGHYDIRENAMPILTNLGMKFSINIDTEIIKTSKPQDFVRVYDILNHVDIKEYFHPSFMSSPISIDKSNPTKTEMEFTTILTTLGAEKRREFTDQMLKNFEKEEIIFSKMLGKEDIKFLSDNSVEIGSHSHTHSILTNISLKEVDYELSRSKDILEEITGAEVKTLAFPNGIYNSAVMDLAKKIGYDHFLKCGDKINTLNIPELESNNYFRINQYHQSFDEALANIYGVTKTIKKWL